MPLSLDAPADVVWDGPPPPGAEVALRSYVLRLRRALGPEAGARIAVHDPGYLIRPAQAELDVLEFEALCLETGRALRGTDWVEALAVGTRALELWRGEPLADVPSQMLRDEATPRLEQLHTQVHEDCLEAALRLGGHELVIPRLREPTAVSAARAVSRPTDGRPGLRPRSTSSADVPSWTNSRLCWRKPTRPAARW